MDKLLKNKIGCDIVKISRIKDLIKDREVIKKIFHPSELDNTDAEHLAGVFAAKEAVIKALGYKPESWLDIEIRYKESGKPYLSLLGDFDTKNIIAKDCSISHDGDYAIAMVSILHY